MSKCFNRECDYNENNICKFNEGKNIEKCRWYEAEIKTSPASDFVDLLNKEMYELKISDLEAKLAESEKSKKSFKVMYFNKCLDYEHLHEKFDDKCAEFELKEYDYKQTIFEKDQDKISLAVEQLEKVKKFVKENESWEIEGSDYSIVYADDVLILIDNQIEELKKELNK